LEKRGCGGGNSDGGDISEKVRRDSCEGLVLESLFSGFRWLVWGIFFQGTRSEK
jgi:hypothetical protein